jgi:hypothetical protein
VRETLALAPAKLGDFLQASALLGALAADAGTRLTVLAADPAVLEAQRLLFPEAEGILLDGDFPAAGGAGGRPAPEGLPRRADLLVNLSLDPRAVELAGSLGAREILGPRPGPSGTVVPKAQRLALAAMSLDRALGRLNLVDVWRALRPACPPALAMPPSLPPLGPAAEEALAASGGLPLVFFHLGAKASLRRWPPEEHAGLAAALFRAAPFAAVTLGSRQERALALKFAGLYRQEAPEAPVIDLSGRTSLADLWGALPRASLLVSSDTGVMHLAASLGIPQLAVFSGPAYAHETGPYGRRSLALQGLAPCGPCTEGKGCRRPSCRALPSWEAALPLALELLKGAKAPASGPVGEGPPVPGPQLSPPPGMAWQSWRTLIGPCGSSLVPCPPLPAPLDLRALAGLMFREAARAAAGLGPPGAEGRSFRPADMETAVRELELYRRLKEPPDGTKAARSLSFIGRKALSGAGLDLFRETWEGVLREAERQGFLRKAP